MKNSMTPPGIEPATFWFVARYLNRFATAVPAPKVKALRYFEMLVTTNTTKEHNTRENLDHEQNGCENFRSCIMEKYF
jgi:hypothetical protein